VAAREIDDRQAQMAEGERACDMDAGLVRAAMGDGQDRADSRRCRTRRFS